MRYSAIALAAIFLASCNRDPNYLKQKYLESGIKYYDAGRYKEASIMFRKSVDADRKFGPAYYRWALTDLKQNQVAAAVPVLRRAIELSKPGTEAADDSSLKLSEILIVAAQQQEKNQPFLNEVQTAIDGFLRRDPNSWQGHKLRADMAMLSTQKLYAAGQIPEAKKELADAIKDYRDALAGKPGDPLITLSLGRTLVVDGQTPEAESLFKSLIDKDKKNLNGFYELYRVYISQQKFPQAEAVLKQAVQNNPKDTQLRLTLAQFYYGTNKRTELLAALNQMKGDLSQFPDAYLQSGDFFLRLNSVDEAIRQYEEGIQKDSARRNLYLKHEIEAYVRAGKTGLAIEKNDQILKNDSKDPEARGMRATLLLDKGDITKAMPELQSVVTARPNNFVARFNLGRAHFARGEYDQARQEFDTAIQLAPDYLPARLAQTQIALIRGDNDAALHSADDTLKIAPNSVQAIVMKSAALQRLQRYDQARALLSAVLEKQPKQVEMLLQLGVLDLSQRKNKEALELFHRAREADPNNLNALMGESQAYLLDGQPGKSVEMVEAAAKEKPADIELQRDLGNAQVSAGQFEKAIATYQGLTGKLSDPRQQSDLLLRIGEAYLRKGDVQQSINSLEKAHAAQPATASTMTSLAELYEMQGKKDVARNYYESSLKADPNQPIALNNLAYLIADSNGDLDLALSYATKAKQRLPNHPEVNDTLGWIYLKKNLTDNAIDTFRSLVVSSPQNPTFHYHYAMALLKKGDRDNARKECQSALAGKPKKEEEDQIHQLMTKLG